MLTRGQEFDRVLGSNWVPTTTSPSRSACATGRPCQAVARRTQDGQSTPEESYISGIQTIGPMELDRRTRRVHIDQQEVALTAKEFDLLAFLANDVGAVHTRTEILEAVWDAHWYGPTKTVDAHVASLRKKLGDHGWIEAVRGVGFRLEPPS